MGMGQTLGSGLTLAEVNVLYCRPTWPIWPSVLKKRISALREFNFAG